MARLDGVSPRRAGLLVRVAYALARRAVGKVPEPMTILAHHPRLLRGFAHMELAQKAAHGVPAPLKILAQIRVAMRIGCPF